MISICRSSTLIWQLKLIPILLAILWTAPAAGQQPVLFRHLSTHPSATLIMRYLNFSRDVHGHDAVQVADIDLNGDGLDEIIVKFIDGSLEVIALPAKGPIRTLGKILASTGIQISDTHDFGVRRIVTTGSPTSDYSRTTYQWNPYHQQYEPAP
jgi:hypothetical protein